MENDCVTSRKIVATMRIGWGEFEFCEYRRRCGELSMPDTPEPERPETTGAPNASPARKTGPLGLILTVVIALVAFGVVAFLFHTQYYTSPAGTLVATPVGSATVNGQTLQHVTLAFNTYPDSTGMVNGKP